ncbi:MFS transporter [Nocardiopsis ansamitocini]|uniref:MFS transporter n=1 Tax=Nocardiopsis ansamitocini TaxID=1670832 RepID=A0A9W6P5L3_9ACTN|nr:MFS transporter [Nocardiopsis ansamitocini]GLU47488.1 MFS transporter [Nocardiopsis ansamitocini]
MAALRGNPWMILIALCIGFFMTLLDLTIVNIAIPDMITHLDAALDEILWVVNAYALVLAVLIITAGRLGDLYGPRRMFIIGVALFTTASTLCGLSPGIGFLIAARVVQGMGAAIMVPQSMALIIRVFPAQHRGAALGVWGSVAGLATVAGPTLGGLLVTALDWRFIFFVNLPFGVVALVLAVLLIPRETGEPQRRQRLDWSGVLLATLALSLLAFGLVEGERFHWGTVYGVVSIPVILTAGGLLFVALLFQQRARQGHDPLIPFALFADRNFGLMNITAALLSMSLLSFSLVFVIYLQSVLGMSALQAGLTLIPTSLVSMVTAPIAGRQVDRYGGKYILFAGFSAFAIGVGWLLLTGGPDSSWHNFLAPQILMGLGTGCAFGPMSSLAMYNVRSQLAGAASGMLNTTRQLGSVLGGAIVGALLQVGLSNQMGAQAAQQARQLPPELRKAFTDGLDRTGGGVQLGGPATPPVLPPGTGPGAAEQISRLMSSVFRDAYLDTMHLLAVFPAAAMVAAAVLTLFTRNNTPRGARGGAPRTTEEAAPRAPRK